MAHPFGGFPLLAEYLRWVESQGCKVQYGVMPDEAGRPFSMIRITAPNDQSVIIVGTDQAERLGPTSISRYDRRLGLSSPFFSWPDDDEEGPVN